MIRVMIRAALALALTTALSACQTAQLTADMGQALSDLLPEQMAQAEPAAGWIEKSWQPFTRYQNWPVFRSQPYPE